MKPIKITQLSDAHLGQKLGDRLLGVDADVCFQQAFNLATSAEFSPDLYLLSGDIASDGHLTAYQRMYEKFRGYDNVVWMPGNHDDAGEMRSVCGGRWLRSRIELGRWQLICLDSSVAGTARGTLADGQLEFLDRTLSQYREQHALIALHHHVLPIGAAWLDEQLVSNSEAFFEVLAKHPQVKAVTSGHVHQNKDVIHQGIRVLTCPSTCVQFAEGSPDFLVSDELPGIRWLDLYPDGRIETGVERVRTAIFQVDKTAKGY